VAQLSITRAFNKHTGVYYAYDVQYVWNEEAQKKLPVRKCIGKFDPETNQIIPNGKRGPKPVCDISETESISDASETLASHNATGISADTTELLGAIARELHQINNTLQEMMGYMKNMATPPQAN